MKIVNKSPDCYYELEVTIKGVKRKYIPLGSYSYHMTGSENCPEDPNNKEQWLQKLSEDFNAPSVLVALSCLFSYYKFEVLDEKDDSLFIDLISKPVFLDFCQKYFGECDFNPDIFMDNCGESSDWKDLGEFLTLDDSDKYYVENGNVFKIINSKGNQTLIDAFDELLIDQRYLEDFEKDYNEIVSLF